MDEIEEVNDDIDIYKLVFTGSNKEKFHLNTFTMPLNFLSDIYNGKISLKEARFKQRDLKKLEELRFNCEPKDKKEKEEIKGVLMQVNGLLEHRNKITDAFRNGTFSSEYLKKSDNTAYDYLLKNVNNFVQKIKLMEEKINLSLKIFLNHHHQLIIQKSLLILKMLMEIKKM